MAHDVAGVLARTLFVGAHLDDIEIGAGGTAAKLSASGRETYFLVLSDSSYDKLDGSLGRDATDALQEGVAAAERLGIGTLDVRTYSAKDLQNASAVVEAIERVINLYKPTAIFTHWPYDTHKAHANAALTTIAAARRERNVFSYEPFHPSGTSYVTFRPQLYVDVDEKAINAKLEALRLHATELRKYGEIWLNALSARAQLRGYEIGCSHAESFEVLRINLA